MLNRFNTLLLLCLLLPLQLLAAVSTGIRLNTVGFLPSHVKRASVLGTPTGGFTLRRAADASAAFTGTLGGPVTNPDTSESLRTADFSSVSEVGNFYLDVPGIGTSPTFAIDPDVYDDPMWVELAGFSIRRCNQAASFTWKGQTFSHGACHLNDAYQDNIGGGHVIKDAKEGWHDAGDYGKYTVNMAFAAAQMLQAWEWHSAVLSQYQLPIPESGNGTPDYLDEMRYALDWILKMRSPNGSFYHKVTTNNFAAFVMPEADTGPTYFVQPSSAATADACAVLSMAARIYAPYDAAFSASCQTAANAAWAWLQANPGELLVGAANQIGTGTYEEASSPGVDDPDHRVWAAAEYWQSTGNAAALSDFETRMAADADKVSLFWDWGEHNNGKRGPKNHGIFTYLLSSRSGRNPTRVADLQAALLAQANAIVATRNAHGYGRPLGTQYHWGSNGTVCRQAMLLDCANQISPDPNYVETALDALGHVYGRNMYARSFVTGVGYNPTMNPHDRLSASDGIVNPVPGHISGGPESTASSWTDTQGDFTTNEIAINWDAGVVAALAMFCTAPPPATPTPTPTPAPCFSTTALRRVNVGGGTVTTGGNTWSADQAYAAGGWGYVGGAISTNSNAIAGTTDDVLYNTGRYGMSAYQFTVANGTYRVQLHMAETYFNAAGARVMSVTLEGQPAISALDIYATVGGSTALVVTKDVTVTDGVLNIGFSATADTAEIRAIAIFPTTPCPSTPTFTPSPNWTATPTATRTPSFTFSPTLTVSATTSPTPSLSPTPCGNVVVVRLNAGGGAYTDGSGNLWAADQYSSNGATSSVTYTVANTTDDVLYQSERYGSPLNYAIPVPSAGSYQVKLLFAETYYNAAGARIFSVNLEGVAAISNLDIYAAAGGSSKALALTRTVTVSDGVLNIDATASVDNAKVDGIEVTFLGPPCSSPTPTFTAGAPSATASPSATPSASPTRSPSATPTGTLSPTPTPSPTASANASGTATPTATRSSTASATPTATGGTTASATPSATRSATLAASPSPTPSASPAGTATLTATPLPGSPTHSPTLSASASATRSATPSATASSTVTATLSPTRSASPTATPSRTVSATPVPTGSSPTLTPTLSPSVSVSPTSTTTAGATKTSSPSATPTLSPAASATRSPTPVPPTLTATWTPFVLPPISFSPTPTWTGTRTPVASPSSTPAATATATPGGTTPSSSDGPLKIEHLVLGPNPSDGLWAQAWVDLKGSADKVQLRIYLPSMVLRGQVELQGSLGPGWNSGPVQLGALPNGLYYIRAVACRGGEKSPPSPALRLVVLR